jgi:hypothetical protein
MSYLRDDLPYLLKNSYKNQKEAAENLKKYGYTYDGALSNNETKVFVKNNKPVIVHRGSKRLSDWAEDALILGGLGSMGHRQKQAERITKRVEQKYGTSADSVGHSLGGRLAENSGNHGQIITYNKAVGLGDIGKKKNSKRQLDIRNSGDIVSVLGHTQKANKEQINKGLSFFNPIGAHNVNHLFSPHAEHS